MASKIVIFLCIQGLIIQTALGQCIGRAPNGPSLNQLLQAIAPHTLIQQQPNIQHHPNIFHQQPQIIQQQPQIIQQLPQLIQQNPALIGENVVSSLNAANQCGGVPAILHDNTVSNNLAHALQLLVVSNLLSNTLPGSPCEDVPAKTYVQPISQYVPPPPPSPPCPFSNGPYVNVY